ncbi:MAG TPA: DUF2630 family protein [Gaiellaceae bacterium]|jgi:hypothetical protein
MNDNAIHETIEQLVAEEHDLWRQEAAGHATEDTRRRLNDLKVTLDRMWDLLHQRQGLRDAGRDPEQATIRPTEVVENYEQ